MSYQQPPDQTVGAPSAQPQGWYPDPGGLQALRWWDGTRWSPHAQPLRRVVPEPSQQPDQYQPQQQAYAPGRHPHAHRAPRRPRNRKARKTLSALGTLKRICHPRAYRA